MPIIQRLAIGLSSLGAGYRDAAQFIRSVWTSDHDVYERVVLDRLNGLLSHFIDNGLLSPPPKLALPLDNMAGLAQLPSLTRQDLREMAGVLQKRYAGDKSVVFFSTGGTTAEPVKLYRPKTTSGIEVASTRLMLEILGWRPGMVRVGLWGANRDLGLAEQTTGIRATLNRALSLVVLKGSYRATDETYLEFLDTLRRYPGCAVYGFSNMLGECAEMMRRKGLGLKPGDVSALWTTAEYLDGKSRREIGEMFAVSPGEFYGARECPAIASTCSHGLWHVNPRYILEALDPDTAEVLPPGEPGDLAITDLFNRATPVLRYRLGDYGHASWRSCACGRNGPVLDEFCGRVSEQIPLTSGILRSTIWLPHAVRYDEIRRAQLVRIAPGAFELRYTGVQLPEADSKRMTGVISEMLENAPVDSLLVQELHKTKQGKCPLFVDECQP